MMWWGSGEPPDGAEGPVDSTQSTSGPQVEEALHNLQVGCQWTSGWGSITQPSGEVPVNIRLWKHYTTFR